MNEQLAANFKYYGISPWEIEVAYNYFNSRFKIIQEEIEEEPDFVSALKIDIPLAFDERFFKWFEYKRWDKIKFLFKEMHRRRGEKKRLKIEINFLGNPNITFEINSVERHWFNNAVEKIDFVLELLPYHLDPIKLPNNVTKVIYHFDTDAARWRLDVAYVRDKKFIFSKEGWKIST